MKTYITQKENGIVLRVYIQPGASKNSIAGEYGDPLRLKVKISAPPAHGVANKELVKFLSKLLKISKSSISILRGETSRHKDLFLEISGHKQCEIVRIINNLS